MVNEARGSPYTLSPEYYDKNPHDLVIADSFSVGVCLLCMLLGRIPYLAPLPQPIKPTDKHRFMIICNQMKKDIGFTQYLCKQFDHQLRQVLLRILEPNPHQRLTIEEFLADQWFAQSLQFEDISDRNKVKQRRRYSADY